MMRLSKFNKVLLTIVGVMSIVASTLYISKNSNKECFGICFTDVNKEMQAKGYKQIGPGKITKNEVEYTPTVYIVEYEGAFNRINSELFRNKLEMVYAKARVKGEDILLIKINSNGGSPWSAMADYEMVKQARDMLGMSIIMQIDGNAYSGGYMLASVADDIYASPGSGVGNIGAAWSMSESPIEAIARKTGLNYKCGGSSDYKELYAGCGGINSKDKLNIVEGMSDDLANKFFEMVREGRKGRITDESLAFNARPYFGYEAIKLGLVDKLQDYRLTIRKYTVGYGYKVFRVEYKRRIPIMEKIFKGGEISFKIGLDENILNKASTEIKI